MTCTNPDKLERERRNVGDGWQPLVDECIEIVSEAPSWTILQIKEKFGGLRFYYSTTGGEGDQRERVWEVEGRSITVCEECGAPGVPGIPTGSTYGWVRTLCPTHSAERDRQAAERWT